ncbi:MAG: YdcF family protein [Betaproteobacteria bacterium]|nr:YdcF family protein [Betaproteobacteria bacterium]
MKSQKSCLKCCLFWVCGALALTAVVSLAALGYAGRWLSAADAPQPADAIIVLGGAFERTLYAADLYASGQASRIYLSQPAREGSHRLLDELGLKIPTEHEISLAILQRKGVPTAHVLSFPATSLSTADEAEQLKQLFAGQRLAVLIVTSSYHIRRSRMVFSDGFAGSEVTLRFVATPYEPYAVDWWHDQESARNTVLELAKIIYYQAGGRFRGSRAG